MTEYTADQKRVSDFIQEVTDGQIGSGEDPIGFLMASYAYMATKLAEPKGEVVRLTYTNHRGETSDRKIQPKSLRYGATSWHPEPQWLLLAFDTDKQAYREFALKDFGRKVA